MREKRIDSSLSYPTYGRGVDPSVSLDTFMINKDLCQGNSPHRRRMGKEFDEDSDDIHKPKIISPRRQKYETQFEKYFAYKHVDKRLDEKPRDLSRDKFDTVTKLRESQNALVRRAMDAINKKPEKEPSLIGLEAKVEKALRLEAIVSLDETFLNNLR